MADEKPKTLTVEAIKFHTYNGRAYEVGDTYEAPADLVDSLAINGMALRMDRASVAKREARRQPAPNVTAAKAPKGRKGKR